ncbi:MarR family transcriptional regulator [Brevibacillus humidisoli]|uniref:MarR family winged helix-turn-helix transcriptional regulator n=1 Tax=Brevibacillus humidisoli TaxID=2895522 RepID=UPI001E48A9E7|nr:MarR family transcriptional regulator [Brevibacillus humidisoli]UFJ40469.1 MarR family transcriptional regulator [Brevibacillus humidisoli]
MSSKEKLLSSLLVHSRKLSTGTVLFHQVIADCLGLNPTDHKCLDIILRTGALTAGELAEQSNLTTGGITGVIDRLEKAGYVVRTKDPADRRRVIVQPVEDKIREVSMLFSSLTEASTSLFSQYKVEELRLILDFLQKSQLVLEQETRKLKETHLL